MLLLKVQPVPLQTFFASAQETCGEFVTSRFQSISLEIDYERDQRLLLCERIHLQLTLIPETEKDVIH